MIEHTAEEYAKYFKVDLKQELAPIQETIDDMLTRLEEFETMIAIIQQERGSVTGITGTLSQVMDMRPQLDVLYKRIDVIENLVNNISDTVDSLESQVQNEEEKLGIHEGNPIKNLLMPLFFKKQPENKVSANAPLENVQLNVDSYFTQNEEQNPN